MKDRKAFALRIDPELYAQIERWAAQELRSVNGQIEWILKDSLQRRTRLEVSELAKSRENHVQVEPPGQLGEGGNMSS